MNQQTRITRHEYLKRVEKIYYWEPTEREKEIMIDLARLYRGSVVLDHWELFQKRYQGHPAWEFAEWFQDLMEEEE